jgi:chlorite dismutase
LAERLLNLYASYAYSPAYWYLEDKDRKCLRVEIADSLREVADATHIYSVFPARNDTDLMFWSTWAADDVNVAGLAMKKYATVAATWRKFLQPVQTLWGFTMPSMYSRGKSEQDIDPLEGPRSPYFVIYPFSKNKEWYLMSMDSRQGMMNEHIKLGKQFFDIKQLLIYSFGLQDQEFVVAYETGDLSKFSDLVKQLRSTEARKYTLIDTPVITCMHQSPQEFVG